MKCVHTFGTGRHKRQADITLLFQYMFLKISVCSLVIAYLDYITNLEILPYLLHFSEVLKIILIIKYFVG